MAEDAHHLPSVLAFYADAGVRPWFEVFPSEEGAGAVAGAIARAGAIPVSYATFLYGGAYRGVPTPRECRSEP